MILRPYQEKGIVDIRALFIQGKRRICYAAPTGSGKTILFVHTARKAVRQGLSVAIIVHRQELVDQTCEALAAEGIEYGVIAAGYPENPDALVQVAMAQTLSRRLRATRTASSFSSSTRLTHPRRDLVALLADGSRTLVSWA